jgi:hypothetical protein
MALLMPHFRCMHVRDHVSILSSYLNIYRQMPPSEECVSFFKQIFMYVVTSCWRKMQRQACHWPMLAFIFHLSHISKADILFRFNVAPTLKGVHSNKCLVKYLQDDKRPPRLIDDLWKCILKWMPISIDLFTFLLSKYNTGGDDLYDSSTSYEFHLLFISSFIFYTCEISKLYKNKNMTNKLERHCKRNILFLYLFPFSLLF